MSAPNTNLDKQTRRHRGPLRGMFAVVLFALVLLFLLGFWAFRSDPTGDAPQVQSGTGIVEGTASDAVTANDRVEEEQGVGTGGAEDPTAVTVPSLQVEAPQSGVDGTQNPVVAPSQAAEPLDPVEGEGENSSADADASE